MRIPTFLAITGAIAITAASSTQALAQALQDQYRKVEYNIPMRDGSTLYTAVYIPRNPQPGKLPILLERTPYGAGPYGQNAYRGNIRGSKSYTMVAISSHFRMSAVRGHRREPS